MTEWNIQSRARICAGCGNRFANRETYHTLLFDERAEFRRSDVCQACWEGQFSQGARERKGFISIGRASMRPRRRAPASRFKGKPPSCSYAS